MAHVRRNTRKVQAKGRPTYSYTVVWTEIARDDRGRPIPHNPERPEGPFKTKAFQETFGTREQAQERADELNAQRNRPTATTASEARRLGDRTFREYAEDWLESMEVRVAAGRLKSDTLADYRGLLERYVFDAPTTRDASKRAPTLGQLPIAQVTPRICEEFLRGLVARNLSQKTIKHAWAQFDRVLRYALRHDAIPSNPAERVEFGTSGIGDQSTFEHHPLTATQVAAAAARVGQQHPEYELMTLFLAYTGVRSAELSGLEIRDLDISHPTSASHLNSGGQPKVTVHVRRTKKRQGGEWKTSTPKSKRSLRSVPLPAWLAGRMVDYLAQHPLADQPEAPLWPSRSVGGSRHKGQLAAAELNYGSPVAGGSFYESILRPALAAEGLPVSRPARDGKPATRGVRLHDLRHTFATMQLMAGTHYLQVSRWLGHATFTLTLDTYGDWIPETEGGVGNALPDPTGGGSAPTRPAAPEGGERLAEVVPLFGRSSISFYG